MWTCNIRFSFLFFFKLKLFKAQTKIRCCCRTAIKQLEYLNDRHPSIQLSHSERETWVPSVLAVFIVYYAKAADTLLQCSSVKAICSSALYCIICPGWIPSRQKHSILYTNCVMASLCVGHPQCAVLRYLEKCFYRKRGRVSSKGEKKGKTDDEGTTPNLIRPKTQKVQFSSVVGANNIFVLDRVWLSFQHRRLVVQPAPWEGLRIV